MRRVWQEIDDAVEECRAHACADPTTVSHVTHSHDPRGATVAEVRAHVEAERRIREGEGGYHDATPLLQEALRWRALEEYRAGTAIRHVGAAVGVSGTAVIRWAHDDPDTEVRPSLRELARAES